MSYIFLRSQVLRPSDSQLDAYPHPFDLRIEVSLLPGTLSQKMTVNNTGDKDMVFTCALHTYFRVSDISKATVTGLGATGYLDSLDNRTEKIWESDAVAFEEEVDRIYMETKGTLKVMEPPFPSSQGFKHAMDWDKA